MLQMFCVDRTSKRSKERPSLSPQGQDAILPGWGSGEESVGSREVKIQVTGEGGWQEPCKGELGGCHRRRD